MTYQPWDDEELTDPEGQKKFKEIQDLSETEGSTVSTAKLRMDICKSCPELSWYFCNNCGCYMPFKTRLRGAKCPINKWLPET